ncbi:MAG: ATP-binding protein, partial [Bacteroidota bacterium]
MPNNKHNRYFVPPAIRWLFDLGVSEDQASWENNLTRLLNQLLLLSSLGNVIMGLYHLMLGNLIPVLFTTVSTLVNIVILRLQYKKMLFPARLGACLYYPLLIFCIISLGGENLHGEYIFFTIAFICALLFQRRWLQIVMATYVIALYTLSQWLLANYQAPFAHISHPLDRYIFFAMSLLSLFFLANSFFSELVKSRQEREALMDQVMTSNAKLKQMNYVVSHDLRSPLRRIASFSDLARRANLRGEQAQTAEFIGLIKDTARKQYDFIKDMLAYAQLDKESIPFKVMDLKVLLAEAHNQFQTENILIDLRTELATVPAFGNPTLLALVFQNLIENAIKYNEATVPQLSISVEATSNWIELRFSDNGIGIAPEYHEAVFDIFTRLHDDSRYEGSGIGLATVKGIVELHQGQIQIEPQTVGTCFLVRIPHLATSQQEVDGQAPTSLGEDSRAKVF